MHKVFPSMTTHSASTSTATREEKRQLLRDLWAVAYADGKLDQYEESQLRKIAELLHVPHTQFIQSKLVAKERLSGSVS